MQTFLAYEGFAASARVLDQKRLGCQRKECLQIISVLSFGPFQRSVKPDAPQSPNWESCPVAEWKADTYAYFYRKTPWYNHPAVQMWLGAELGLIEYGAAVCNEWLRRGYDDTCRPKMLGYKGRFEASGNSKHRPWWLGDERFHVSHQSNLIRKDPETYRKLWPGVAADLEYWWPTKERKGGIDDVKCMVQ